MRRSSSPGRGPGVGDGGAGLLVALVVAATGVATGYGVVLWGLGRGFDWSDEAFVSTMIASDRVAVGEAWGFQHLVHPLYRLTGESILALRVLRLVGYALTSVLLVLAARHVARGARVALPRHTWPFVLLVAQAGTLLAWSYPPRYLGYNELSAWLSQLICASVVVGLAGRSTGPRAPGTWLPWAAVGLMVPPLLMAKFTAGLVWIPVVLLATLVAPTMRSVAGRAVAVSLGAGSAVLALVAAGMPLAGTVDRSWTMLLDPSAQETSSHSVPEILGTYLESAGDTVVAGLLPVALIVLQAVLLRRTGSGPGAFGRVVVAALPLLLAGGLLALPLDPWTKLGTTATVMGVGGAAVLLVACRPARAVPRAVLAAGLTTLLLVLITPVVAGVGTNNAVMGQTLFAATVWAVLLGVALAVLAGSSSGGPVVRAAPLLTGALLVWVVVVHVTTDTFVHPYRSEPLQEQTTGTSVPELAGIRLTPEQAGMASWLHTVAGREEAGGVPAVAIASPGHLFAFNHSGWASPWRGGSWLASIEAACRAGRPDDLFVLDPGGSAPGVQEDRDELPRALSACGYAFPEDFRAVDERAGTVVWRLR